MGEPEGIEGNQPPNQNQIWNSLLPLVLVLDIGHAYLLKNKHPSIENKMLQCQHLHLHFILAAKDKEKNKEKKFKEFVRVKPKKKKKKKKKTKPGNFSLWSVLLGFLYCGWGVDDFSLVMALESAPRAGRASRLLLELVHSA